MAIFFTQAPLILFFGAKHDLMFGFNRLDAGLPILLFLCAMAPLFNLSWLIAEMVQFVRLSRGRGGLASFSMPLAALFFLMESAAIDLYIASHARM